MIRKRTRHRPVKPRPHAAAAGKVTMSRSKRAGFLLATIFLLAVCAEGLFAIGLRITEGQWIYSRPKSANYLLFEPHPEWLLTPRKNADVTVQGNRHHHNADGFRGSEFLQPKTKCRIACLGGSTTYCVGVADDQTWPFYLGQLLPPDFEVLNFGIPGHSTSEHKKLLPHVLEKYSPDVVVFQMGLNDLRSMNVADPGADYEKFHQPSLRFSATGACRRDWLPNCALIQGTVVLLETMKILGNSPFPHGAPAGHLSDSVDPRIVETFSNNLTILLQACQAKHVRVVLLPHALSPETISETNYKWWAPYLTKQGIFNAEAALNAVMQRRADGDKIIYGSFIEDAHWNGTQFCDPTHLNANGNLRLAQLLQAGVPWRQLLVAEPPAAK